MNEKRERLVITFTLGVEQFAIPIDPVQEIIRLVALTKLPRLPEVFDGVINLRGRVIPVVDVRRFLGNSDCLPTRKARIIIMEIGTHQVIGFIVDTVMDVEQLDPGMVEPPPMPDSDAEAGLISGVVKGSKGLFAILDLPRLLSAEQLAAARSVGSQLPAVRANTSL